MFPLITHTHTRTCTSILDSALPQMLLLFPTFPRSTSFSGLKGKPPEPASIVAGASRSFVDSTPTPINTQWPLVANLTALSVFGLLNLYQIVTLLGTSSRNNRKPSSQHFLWLLNSTLLGFPHLSLSFFFPSLCWLKLLYQIALVRGPLALVFAFLPSLFMLCSNILRLVL